MNKILRYSFVALLAVLGMGNAFAEDIIWQEDWTGCSADVLPTNANYTFTGTTYNDDGSIKSGTKIYEQNLAGGVAPELLVAKNGGSFAAKVALNGKSGNMTLAYKTNRNDLVVEVEGATLSEKTRSGNDDMYTVTVASGTNEITITFKMTSNSNARLDNIELYQGQGKTPAGLSWGTSARTVTIGATDNQFPELQNAHNLAVTYSSSETGVATIAADGTITLVAAGTTVITAESAETDEYEAGKAEYTLTVKDAPAPAQEIGVAEAIQIIMALENGKTTEEVYKVTGIVSVIDEINTSFGNATFDIVAQVTRADGDPTTLKVYRAKDAEGNKITNENIVKVGDVVVVEGKLQKYVKDNVVTPEIAQGGKILTVNGESTGITNITVKKAFEGAIYNVAGQKVDKSYKGLVIINGKKIVNK